MPLTPEDLQNPARLRFEQQLARIVPAVVAERVPPRAESIFDGYQKHGQLHWRNRLCSVSQSRPAKEAEATK
jgi:hypothetical protein